LTIAALAEAKGLPPEFLREWDVREASGGLIIPYRDARGQIVAERIRTHVTARRGSYWRPGDRPAAYGAHRLDGAAELILVEGETDSWTLALHSFPVLGLPGATQAGKLAPEYVRPANTIYVVREPDRGGQTFVDGVRRRLAALAWPGQLRIIAMETLGAKDPNDLFQADPDGFAARFRQAMAEAVPVECLPRRHKDTKKNSCGEEGAAREETSTGNDNGGPNSSTDQKNKNTDLKTQRQKSKTREANELSGAEPRSSVAGTSLEDSTAVDNATGKGADFSQHRDCGRQEERDRREYQPPDGPYTADSRGIFYLRPRGEEVEAVRLTNFTARIVADIRRDDGVEHSRVFRIEASLAHRRQVVEVPARQFESLGWILDLLGAAALVYPGRTLRDHVRAAIQVLSHNVARETVFAHHGWRRIEECWVYLHGDGAIGAGGTVTDVQVALPEMVGGFRLPDPPPARQLQAVAAASLALLDAAPDDVSVPVYAAVWRAVLGPADFGVHLAGSTGTGKTELAALAQQHFGAGLDARHLPGGWSSTSNALEALAFVLKDALFVVDDFAPTGAATDVGRIHREAERLFRAQGNRAGRLRLNQDASLQAARPPRGLILSTGEEIPRGHSVRARLLIVELAPGQLDWTRVTPAQTAAARGEFAALLAGFVQWLAGCYKALTQWLQEERPRRRAAWRDSAVHKRTVANVVELQLAMDVFGRFLTERQLVSPSEAEHLQQRVGQALERVAVRQAVQQAAADPVQRFLELLQAALGAGEAHIVDREGRGDVAPPRHQGAKKRVVLGEEKDARGIRAEGHRPNGQSLSERGFAYSAQGNEPIPEDPTCPADHAPAAGPCVGWRDGADLYLEPHAAYRAAQAMAGDRGEALGVSVRTLSKRLHERGLLQSTDDARQTLTVRRTLAGRPRNVLHCPARLLSILES